MSRTCSHIWIGALVTGMSLCGCFGPPSSVNPDATVSLDADVADAIVIDAWKYADAAGFPDAANVDALVPDAAKPDAQSPIDASVADASEMDASLIDASVADASVSDTSVADATPDALSTDAGICGTTTSSAAPITGGGCTLWELSSGVPALVPRVVAGRASGPVYVGGHEGLMRLVGNAWCTEPGPPSRAILALWLSPTNTLFALTTGACSGAFDTCGEVFEIWRRPDGGSWQQRFVATALAANGYVLWLSLGSVWAQLIGNGDDNVYGLVMLRELGNGTEQPATPVHGNGTSWISGNPVCSVLNGSYPGFMIGDHLAVQCDEDISLAEYSPNLQFQKTIPTGTFGFPFQLRPETSPELLVGDYGSGAPQPGDLWSWSGTATTMSSVTIPAHNGIILGGSWPDLYVWQEYNSWKNANAAFSGYVASYHPQGPNRVVVDANRVFMLAYTTTTHGVLMCDL